MELLKRHTGNERNKNLIDILEGARELIIFRDFKKYLTILE